MASVPPKAMHRWLVVDGGGSQSNERLKNGPLRCRGHMVGWRMSRRWMSSVTGRAAGSMEELRRVLPITLDIHRLRGLPASAIPSVAYHPDAPERSSLASRIRVRLPLSTSPELREQYALFGSPHLLRLGRVLEDLDGIAGDIAYRHAGQGSSSIVTACMDRMALFHRMSTNDDLEIDGAVTWVGTTSLNIDLVVRSVCADRAATPLAKSSFLMVSRTKEQNNGVPVPKLVPADAEESERFRQVQQRRSHRGRPARACAPGLSGPEAALIDELHKSRLESPDGFVWQRDASDARTLLMHSQSRNIYGRIFGGYLMAQAYELAWLTTYKLARAMPTPTFIDDVTFIRPVEIASVVTMNARVVYASTTEALVDVEAIVQQPATGESVLTNTFHFGFDVGPRCRPVVPDSYREILSFAEGRRRFQQCQAGLSS